MHDQPGVRPSSGAATRECQKALENQYVSVPSGVAARRPNIVSAPFAHPKPETRIFHTSYFILHNLAFIPPRPWTLDSTRLAAFSFHTSYFILHNLAFSLSSRPPR